MRFLTLAVLALILVSAPALAQQSAVPQPGGQNGYQPAPPSFGSITCFPRVPCSDSSGSLSSDAYTSNADACIAQHFGTPSDGSSSFFDGTGVDSNGCLTTKPLTAPNGKSLILPHCCLIKLQNDQCAFHCEMTRK